MALCHSPFARAFAGPARFAPARGEPITTRVERIGDLQVPTGRIHVSDPFTSAYSPGAGLARIAPTGVFPVELCIAVFPPQGDQPGDQRVACARVRFADRPAVRWEVAAFAGDPAPVGDAIPGYGVDAGTGCFHDEAACGDLDEATSNAWLAAHDRSYVHTRSWHVAALHGANIATFSSGFGDGFYGSFWGLDDSGAIVELVTDFDVLLEPSTVRVELPLPLPRGPVGHPVFTDGKVTLRRALFGSNKVIVGGPGGARVELSNGATVTMSRKNDERTFTWDEQSADCKLVVLVMGPLQPMDVLG